MDTEKLSIILIPVGSHEFHGSFLPSSTDTVLATFIAHNLELRLSKQFTVNTMPHVSYGVSSEHARYHDTISITPEHYLHYIQDVLTTVPTAESHQSLIVLVNGHGGNTDLLRVAMHEFNYTHSHEKCFLLNLKDTNTAVIAQRIFGHDDTHGGTVEGSLYFYAIGQQKKEAHTASEHKKKVSRGLDYFRLDELTSTGIINDDSTVTIDTDLGGMYANETLTYYESEIRKIITNINTILCPQTP